MAEEKNPDQIRVEGFLESARFQMGIGALWGEPVLIWPHMLIQVFAAARTNSPPSYCFRFELTSYPVQGPTACVWDRAKNQLASNDDFPEGGDIVRAVFQPGQNYLYLPCDRLANPTGHPEWKISHPELLWTNSKDLTLYLHEIHRLLNSKSYKGIRRPRPADEFPA